MRWGYGPEAGRSQAGRSSDSVAGLRLRAQPDEPLRAILGHLGQVAAGGEEVGEGTVAERLFVEGRVHPAHLVLDRAGIQPFVGVALGVTDLQGANKKLRRERLRVDVLGRLRVVVGESSVCENIGIVGARRVRVAAVSCSGASAASVP